MSSSRTRLALSHIQTAIDAIESFTKDLGFSDFRADRRDAWGQMRKRFAPASLGTKVRGVGNWLRHQYDRIDLQSIWDTVNDDLPPLKTAVRAALLRLPE